MPLFCLLIALLLTSLAPSGALGAKRVALVIGNAAYKHTPVLRNTKNDAADIGAALERLGFKVLLRRDLDKAGMDRAVRDFSQALEKADVAAFFYAGHALQYAGRNYFVPIDAKLTTEDALDFEMTRLRLVQKVMERKTKTNILFLDACRDNPLARNLARALGTRSTSMGKGLAHVEAGVGTLISYATQPGNVALDGAGRNSPYTAALKTHILTPGLDITSILIGVRLDVMKATGNKQVPWDQHALTARLVLTPEPGQAGQPKPGIGLSEAGRAWIRIASSRDIKALEAFRARYAASAPHYGRLAEQRIAALKAESGQVRNSPPRADAADTLACITIGRDIDEPKDIRVGTRFCDDSGRNTASVEKIANRAVVFSVNGASRFTCRQGELCGFNWPVKPLFRITARADRARGIAPQASIMPR